MRASFSVRSSQHNTRVFTFLILENDTLTNSKQHLIHCRVRIAATAVLALALTVQVPEAWTSTRKGHTHVQCHVHVHGIRSPVFLLHHAGHGGFSALPLAGPPYLIRASRRADISNPRACPLGEQRKSAAGGYGSAAQAQRAGHVTARTCSCPRVKIPGVAGRFWWPVNIGVRVSFGPGFWSTYVRQSFSSVFVTRCARPCRC